MFKIDIKTLIMIVTLAAALGGFYYTTQARLDVVEREILFLQRQVQALKNQDKRLNKQLNNLIQRKGK